MYSTSCAGCASIAQVHRARLAADGTEVVLKLQVLNLSYLQCGLAASPTLMPTLLTGFVDAASRHRAAHGT